MNTRSRFLARFAGLIATVAMIHPLLAQRAIEYRLTAFGTGKVPLMKLVNAPGSENVVEAAKNFVTLPIEAKLRDDTYLDFFAEGTPVPAEGETVTPLCSVRVPSGAQKDLLVILLHEGKNKVKPLFLDFKRLDFKKGEQFVLNYLPVPIEIGYEADGKKAGKSVVIKPKQKLNIGKPPEARSIRKAYHPDRKTNKRVEFSSALCFTDPDAREILFCYANKKGKPVLQPVNIYNVPKEATARSNGR